MELDPNLPLYLYVFPPPPGSMKTETYIYAQSEELAKAQFKEYFIVEPGALIRRDPW